VSQGGSGSGGGRGGGHGNGGRTTAGPGGRNAHVRLQSSRKRSASSRRWLERQLNDPYVAEAKRRGYRSRAAFKLLELDARWRLLRPGATVVDLGAAPGGWTQVAVERVGAGQPGGGRVIALDLLAMDAVAGAELITADFLDPAVPEDLVARLGRPADLVLSDLAPSTTGHSGADHLRIMALAEAAFDFAAAVLGPGGGFVCKVFQGGTEATLLARVKQRFATVRHVKPPASRADSAELYLVATGFRLA